MPDWLLTAFLASVPGIAAAGGLLVKVNRLERDVEQCVRRELYDAERRALVEKLDKIERSLERLLDRLERHDRGGRDE